MILAQIELDPETVRTLSLGTNGLLAWSGWILLLLGARARFRATAPRLASYAGLIALLPALWIAPGRLFPKGGAVLGAATPLDTASVLAFYGLEAACAVLSVVWGTLIYFRWVRQWSGRKA
ncbi:MAG TPA: hypothetical protein VIM58_02640 [Candidatus Methylacidiphilales bacterium]